jgi:hypothetical protein
VKEREAERVSVGWPELVRVCVELKEGVLE